jgi:hypothetical protein
VDEAEPELGRDRRGVDVDDLAVDQDLAGVRDVEACEHLDEGGLAGAVGADEPVDLTACDLQVDVPERLDTAVPLAEAPDLEPRRSFVAHPGHGQLSSSGWSAMNCSTFSWVMSTPGTSISMGSQSSPAAMAFSISSTRTSPSRTLSAQ